MAPYRHPALRKLLHTYKYEGVDEAGEALDGLFGIFLGQKTALLATVLSGAKVTTVPLHPFRRAARGFDQCEKFADRLAACLGLERSAVLSRKFRLKTQVSIASDELRRRNAAGSVICPVPVADGKFVIFDDVTTTGATLEECAKALKSAGAGEVWAVTLLRG
jgi:ComF family protein